ncbi:MAG: hypothetical protein QW134_02135 [Nitrososphaeria archaeon]
MSRSVFIVIGFLVTLVVVLSGLVGFFYGQSQVPVRTTTIMETKTVTETLTKTVTFTPTQSITPVTTVTISTTTPTTIYLFEKLEIVNAYATKLTGNSWTIYLSVKNTGSMDSTITEIFINGKPYTVAGGTLIGASLPSYMPVGSSRTITISVITSNSSPYTSGQTIEVKIHTATGAEYPKAVVLP